ncbi:hypothetical protein MJH54_30585, partial [Salmonella enterica subsp. enterica serovar Montevideo]|nr:hypothetical protein [Salmonella enterica subsp. enterica serovar Montevideo]
PKVGIVYNYANASDLPAKALVDAGYDGIVSAGVGNGNLYKTVMTFMRIEIMIDKEQKISQSTLDALESELYRNLRPLYPKTVIR